MLLRFQQLLLLLSLCAVTSIYGQETDAREVITKWRTAVHAVPWKKTTGAMLNIYSNADSIAGTSLINITARTMYKSTNYRQYDTTEIVVNGESATMLDWNGFLRTLRGKELRRLKTEIFERKVEAFGPPSAGVTVAGNDSSGPILRFAVRDGDSSTWYIDRHTGLPLKSLRAGDDSKITTVYENWKEEHGHVMPHSGYVSETEKPDYSWNVSTVSFEDEMGEEHFKPSVQATSDASIEANAPPVPFNFENSHLIFNVALNKHEPMLFLLDTGADENVINGPRLAEFGLESYGKTSATGGGGTADYSYARGATFRLPGIELRNQHVAIIDESGIEAAYGMMLGGILGYDFISRFVIEIDYAKSELIFHDPKTWSYSGNGVIVPVTFDNGIPFTDATISVPTKPAIPAYMLLDFGATETMTLTSPFVKDNNLLALAGTNTAVNKMAGLENQFFSQTNVRGHIDKLVMGKFIAESFPVNLSVNTKGAYASTNFAGTIGEGIYRRYHVFLDYARDRVIFEPTAEAAKPYPERMTYGLTLLASGDDLHTYTIAGVRAGSPAETDGFKKGDIIASLNGKSASQFTLGQLRDNLTHDDAKLEMKILREKNEIVKSVVVKRVSLEKK
jgi:hypothetical protein